MPTDMKSEPPTANEPDVKASRDGAKHEWKSLARASSRPPPAVPVHDDLDPRAHAAWRSWLAALAHDPEAAAAAALAYESLEDAGRNAWLDALDGDAPDVDVPRVALYAPLFAVEHDEARRDRIASSMKSANDLRPGEPHALRGVAASGEIVCVVVSPLYLDFVELLVCRLASDMDDSEGLTFARHEPLLNARDLDREADRVGILKGTALTKTSLRDLVEEIAHAVVADRRSGRGSPPALLRFLHLFAPELSTAAQGMG
jgi:hypothetical protein